MPLLARSALSLALLGALVAPAIAAPPGRVVLLSLDGAGEHMIERMLAEGRMPNLARLRAEGTAADYARTAYTTKTAAGHASLWTGAWGDRNGITANSVPARPLATHSILDRTSGFEATALEAEPLFVSAARQGRCVTALNLPQSWPLSVYEPGGKFGEGLGDRLFLFSGFDSTPAKEGTWSERDGLAPATGWQHLPASVAPPLESRHALGGGELFALLLDDPEDPAVGYDTCWLTTGRDAATTFARLKPRAAGQPEGWSPLVSVRVGGSLWGTYFRLFDLSADGRRFLLYHTAPSDPRTDRPDWMPAYFQAGGGHVEAGAAGSYAAGRLGTTLADGGDGVAEARYLETVRFALQRASFTAAYFLKSHPWDLFMHYLPVPDQAEHMWYGYLEPGSPAYDPAIAERLRPSMTGVFEAVDAYLGELRRAVPKDADLVLVSDHGMGPCAWDFKPNVALARAGLLALDAAGKVDLSRTKALYSPNDGAYVVVNRVGRPGGIVPAAEVPAVLAEVRRALGGVRVKTPVGDRPLLTFQAPTPALTKELGIGGPYGGDLYLDTLPGYALSADAHGEDLFVPRPTNTSGFHMVDARRTDMHAIFYGVGPHFKRGAAIGGVRTIDVAPTIAHILGIAPPKQATGRVLTEALRR